MSFACTVERVEIEPHPNADRLEIAKVNGYRACVRKDALQSGDLAVYIPEAALLPDWLIEHMGLEGMLSGARKNRVKAVKLRGELSQGLVLPVKRMGQNMNGEIQSVADRFEGSWAPGDDLTELLEIKKYEPTVPVSMQGKIAKGNYFDFAFKYDPENIKKRVPFEPEEQVVMLEKIHGTFVVVAFIPDAIAMREAIPHSILISSKGLWARGQVLDAQNDQDNLYVRTIKRSGLVDAFMRHPDLGEDIERPLYFMGEIFGRGVQDLHYGANEPQVRFFDMAVQLPNREIMYLDYPTFRGVMWDMNIPTAPLLYTGPYNQEMVNAYTSGEEMVSGEKLHMREGVVIKSLQERLDARGNRCIVKSVSADYLLRKNGTEYN